MGIFIKKKNGRPNFWSFHIITWGGFMFYDFFANQNTLNYLWLATHALGFSIAVCLRFNYRFFFNRLQNLWIRTIFVIVSSFLAASAWYFLRGFLFLFFFRLSSSQYLDYLQMYNYPGNLFASLLYLASPFFGWSIGYLGLKYYVTLIDEKRKSESIQLQAKNAQLQMLRYQINPHFLFNSLNSIKALAFENPEQASFMITELSEFLRITLSYNDKIFIPVSEEIEIIEKYLTIEKIRFEERLDYNISVDSTLIDKKILCFITQPLVENAIKHGMAYKPDGIRLSVFFRQIDQYIAIEIVNEGKLIENGNSTGTGLKNVRERLENAYFKEYILTMTEEGQLVKVRLLLPEIT